MKTIKYLLLAVVAICLASCGGKKNSKEKEEIVLFPETTHIKGDLGDYFEVVDRKYNIVTDNWGDMVSIEVKRTGVDYAFNTKGIEPYGIYGQGVNGNVGFGIEILDENGNLIEKAAATEGGLGGMYSHDDMKEAIKLKAGETGIVRWSFDFNGDKKPVKFRLTSAYEETDRSDWDSSSSSSKEDSSSSDDSDDDDSFSSSSSDSEDWDALLDSYDSYVTKYISYVKKAAKGDMSAFAEYPTLLQKAQEFSQKLDNARGDMSVAQLTRYMGITYKMNLVISEME